MAPLLVRCGACGAVTRIVVEPGSRPASLSTVEHESSCPFFAAVKRSTRDAQRWISEHGYPISAEAAS
jgi:hypothetical protein